MPSTTNWQLEDYTDTLDTQEVTNAAGEVEKIQIRDHWVFARYRKIHASHPFTSEVASTTSSITYYVGTAMKHKAFIGSASSPKYICVQNGFQPEQPGTPGDWAIERQIWEYYSAWRDAPSGWNV
jgi:hypothetical protein